MPGDEGVDYVAQEVWIAAKEALLTGTVSMDDAVIRARRIAARLRAPAPSGAGTGYRAALDALRRIEYDKAMRCPVCNGAVDNGHRIPCALLETMDAIAAEVADEGPPAPPPREGEGQTEDT